MQNGKTWVLLTKGCFVLSLDFNPSVLGVRALNFINILPLFYYHFSLKKKNKQFFKFHQCIFFHNTSRLNRAWSSFWTNLNFLYPKIHCFKSSLNWSIDSQEDIWISAMYFCDFIMISSWKRAWPFVWTNLYSCHTNV